MKAKHSCESSEWYTPASIMEYVRRVLGVIDLDPCTTPQANEVVKARKIYCAEDDGLSQDWSGASTVYVNPPSGKGELIKWWLKALEYYFTADGDAIFMLYNIQQLQTLQNQTGYEVHHPLDFVVCILQKRIAYTAPDGSRRSAPPHASAVVYLGAKEHEFVEHFSELGYCVIQKQPLVLDM